MTLTPRYHRQPLVFSALEPAGGDAVADDLSCSGSAATGMTDRRSVLRGAGATAISFSALPTLAALLADPTLAQAAAGATQTVSVTTADGRTESAALALPEGEGPHPAVMLIHEWWGLNDQIRSMAMEVARQGYVALAIDLYHGDVATVPEDAKRYSSSVNNDEALATLDAWVSWLNENPDAARAADGSRARLATLGWCFGGTWSLNASLAHPVDGTVVYYGKVDRSATELAHLNGPVLGHFATRDQWITERVVTAFTTAMEEAGKRDEVYWYDADHAFANPTGSRYDADDARLAWERTSTFLAQVLKS